MIRSFIHRGHGLYDNFWQSIKRNIDLNRFSFYKIIFLSHYIPKNPKIRNEKLKKKITLTYYLDQMGKTRF